MLQREMIQIKEHLIICVEEEILGYKFIFFSASINPFSCTDNKCVHYIIGVLEITNTTG